MNNINTTNQSFNVDDIRRLRDEADMRYKDMPFNEVVRDISAGAKEGLKILEQLKLKKAARRVM